MANELRSLRRQLADAGFDLIRSRGGAEVYQHTNGRRFTLPSRPPRGRRGNMARNLVRNVERVIEEVSR